MAIIFWYYQDSECFDTIILNQIKEQRFNLH